MKASRARRHWQRPRQLPAVRIDRQPNARISHAEKDRVATSNSFQAILELSSFYVNDPESTRRRRWKEVRYLWSQTALPESALSNVENALWFGGNFDIDVDHFVAAMVSRFQLRDPGAAGRLRCLYHTFEGGAASLVDWRDVMAALRLVIFFRLVRNAPVQLLLMLFDIYASTAEREDVNYRTLAQTEIRSDLLLRIFDLPAVHAHDALAMSESARKLVAEVLGTHLGETRRSAVSKAAFSERISSDAHEHLVRRWQGLVWECLPSDLRLHCVDEAQLEAIRLSDRLAMKALQNRALKMRHLQLLSYFYSEWRKITVYRNIINGLVRSKLLRQRRAMFEFWFYRYTLPLANKRRKRRLAEAMGCLRTKAHCFLRIKLFNDNNLRIRRCAGKYDRASKQMQQGLARMRVFQHLQRKKTAFHRWWDETAHSINMELSAALATRNRRCNHFRAWAKLSAERSLARRREAVALENQTNFMANIKETAEAVEELVAIEEERRRVVAEEKQRKRDEEVAERRRAQREEVLRDRAADAALVTGMQREGRAARIEAELRELTREFKARTATMQRNVLASQRNEVEKYLHDDANAKAIKMRFRQLRSEFYAPPNFEYEERERILTSSLKISMLFAFVKMRELDVELSQFLKHFDKEGRGFLTSAEAVEMLTSLEVPGITAIGIRSIVSEMNGSEHEYVTLEKVAKAMEGIECMGVPGSVWKLYVDPVQNVLMYRNFATGRCVYEHEMDDALLNDINTANIYGDGVDRALAMAKETREKDWDSTLKTYMVRRIQYLFRLRLARKGRRQNLWKVDNRELGQLKAREKEARVVRDRCLLGHVGRFRFKRQLYMTFEKVWDASLGLPYYYNHSNQNSTWEMPFYLRRYGDAADPLPWIAVHAEGSTAETPIVSEFYNVPARRAIPRKPDGYLLCKAATKSESCGYFAVKYCSDCGVNACFACHRGRHASFLGFRQRFRPSPFQRADPVFMSDYQRSLETHSWSKTLQPLPCELCSDGSHTTTRLAAYVHCSSCDKTMCRTCARRLHSHGRFKDHAFAAIE